VTAFQDSTRTHGPVQDVVQEVEDQLTKDNVNQLTHVSAQDNTMVSGMLLIVVPVEHAHQELDTLLDLTEVDVTESDKLVTAFPDSMKTHGNVLDVKVVKEDQLTKELANHLSHVTETSNILVSTILKAVVSAEAAHKVQDGSSDKIDSDATELDQIVTASLDLMKTHGPVRDVQVAKEDQ
jgi:hypothetical protein